MIRINLLTVEKAAPKRSFSFNFGLVRMGSLASAFVLGAALLYIGHDFYTIYNDGIRLDGELAAAQAEKLRLAPVLQQVDRFEQRRKELQQRVSLIEELRRNQVGPVHLLDQVSRSVPDRLWLTDLKQVGDDVQMDGRTSSLTSLADFVGNLETSGYFKRPVEILSSEEERSSDKDLIKFSVKATFSMPGQKPAATPAPGAPGAKRLAR